MKFSQLYHHVNGLTTDLIALEGVKTFVVAHHDEVGEVNFSAVELDPEVCLGYILYERDRDSPYEDEFTIMNIRVARHLNLCWRRYVCCKELMHAFDSSAQKVDSRDKFLRLMGEFQTVPLPKDISDMFMSEIWAEWMAILILCPQRLRDKYIADWKAGQLSDFDVALKLRIPEAAIPAVMGEYYLTALGHLVGQTE